MGVNNGDVILSSPSFIGAIGRKLGGILVLGSALNGDKYEN